MAASCGVCRGKVEWRESVAQHVRRDAATGRARSGCDLIMRCDEMQTPWRRVNPLPASYDLEMLPSGKNALKACRNRQSTSDGISTMLLSANMHADTPESSEMWRYAM
eukprot:6203616-Pleurochrysis_carterae.AAC.1